MIYTFRYIGQTRPLIAFCDSEAIRVAAKLRELGLDYIMTPYPYIFDESRVAEKSTVFCRR